MKIFLKNFTLSIFFYLSTVSQAQTSQTRIAGYFGIVHPIVTFSNNTTTNFKDYYLVGFLTGINVWKNPNLGFSFEVVPYIRAASGARVK